MSELLSVEVREEADATIVAATGELDLSSCGILAEALEGLNGASCVVVDLSRCTFIDSSGLAVLVRYANQSEEIQQTLRVRVSQQIRRIFDITRLAERLHVENA